MGTAPMHRPDSLPPLQYGHGAGHEPAWVHSNPPGQSSYVWTQRALEVSFLYHIGRTRGKLLIHTGHGNVRGALHPDRRLHRSAEHPTISSRPFVTRQKGTSRRHTAQK